MLTALKRIFAVVVVMLILDVLTYFTLGVNVGSGLRHMAFNVSVFLMFNLFFYWESKEYFYKIEK